MHGQPMTIFQSATLEKFRKATGIDDSDEPLEDRVFLCDVMGRMQGKSMKLNI